MSDGVDFHGYRFLVDDCSTQEQDCGGMEYGMVDEITKPEKEEARRRTTGRSIRVQNQ